MPANDSQVLIARRYLDKGFIDAAMRLFARNPGSVGAADWQRLAEALMERRRVSEAVAVCELGGIPVPRERLLALGDEQLRRRSVKSAIEFYELAEADRGRWAQVVDMLAAVPERELLAIKIAERYLSDEEDDAPSRVDVHVADAKLLSHASAPAMTLV
jgi:hypothetical protein